MAQLYKFPRSPPENEDEDRGHSFAVLWALFLVPAFLLACLVADTIDWLLGDGDEER